MNEFADNLGMKNSSFNNASGLPDPLNVTSAYDLALLTAALIKDFLNNISFIQRSTLLTTALNKPIEIDCCGEMKYLMVVKLVTPQRLVIV